MRCSRRLRTNLRGRDSAADYDLRVWNSKPCTIYLHELRDLYSAEQQLIKALSKMSKAATNRQLSAGFAHHLQQTKRHATRLEKIFERLEESGRGPKCEGMEGLIAEGDKMAKEEAEDEVRDAGLDRRSTTGGALRDRRLRLRSDLCRIA